MYTKHTINNVNLDEFDKILNQNISRHNKIFDLYLYKLTFPLEISIIPLQSKETNYQLNEDDDHMKSLLSRFIDFFTSIGYKFCIINHITINSINDRCIMTYE